jgi:hypothetical protein
MDPPPILFVLRLAVCATPREARSHGAGHEIYQRDGLLAHVSALAAGKTLDRVAEVVQSISAKAVVDAGSEPTVTTLAD